jgi:transposase
MQITTIGLDLAKSVFQVHGIDAAGQVVVRKSVRRAQMLAFFSKLPPCLVGIEACGTSHYWARELIRLGHEVRLMPPAYVKPYVKRGKTDAADAEAVCEAVTRPTMRFVPVKSPEQQAALSMHRTRDLLVKQRTQLINMLRGILAEFGVDIPKGLERALLMARQVIEGNAPEVPIEAARIATTLSQQALDIHVRLRQIDRDLAIWLRGNDVARRLMTIPGIGTVGATALVASVTDPHQFRSGRQFAAWLGLTPLQKSSGGKEPLFATSEVERWQRAARSYQQDGRQIPAQAAHCWHDLTCTPCKIRSRQDRSTAGRSAGAKADEGRYRRNGEQDRAGHLGDHGTWRNLSHRPPAGIGSITTIQDPAEEEINDTRLRARCDVMADRSDREQGQPK